MAGWHHCHTQRVRRSSPVVYSQLQPYANEEHAIPEITRSGRPSSPWARGCATVPHILEWTDN